jgi:hypothetical protein
MSGSTFNVVVEEAVLFPTEIPFGGMLESAVSLLMGFVTRMSMFKV